MSQQEQFSLPLGHTDSSDVPQQEAVIPFVMPKSNTDTTSETERPRFEACLQSLDASVPKGHITYTAMFSSLRTEQQDSIRTFLTHEKAIGAAIRGGYEQISADATHGIEANCATLPLKKSIANSGNSAHRVSTNRLPDIKKIASGDAS